MRQKTYSVLRAFLFAAAALHLAACASAPTSTPTSPTGGTPLSASNTAASGPLLGSWWDSNTKALHNVYGVLGAAHQGAPTLSDGSYSSAAACARKSFALLTTPSGSLFSVALPQGEPVAIASNANPKATIVFSPSCLTSLVYAPGSSAALLVRGLPSNPVVAGVTLPAGTSSAAIADSGSILAAVSVADGTTAIQLLANGTNAAQPVTILSKFGGMAFVPAADTAILADASANTVVEASHLTSNMSLASLASGTDGVSNPAAVAISADGRLAAVANAKGSSVLRLDLSGQSAPVKTVCRCSPAELVPLAGNFAFRLNEPGSGTVWAFDGNGSQPRVLFIPSDQPVSAGQAVSAGHGGSR
jgi:hypothetical protein